MRASNPQISQKNVSVAIYLRNYSTIIELHAQVMIVASLMTFHNTINLLAENKKMKQGDDLFLSSNKNVQNIHKTGICGNKDTK